MPWGKIGAVFVVLLVVFLFGRLWFALIEGILGRLRKIFSCCRKQETWHTLSEEESKTEK